MKMARSSANDVTHFCDRCLDEKKKIPEQDKTRFLAVFE
jgi:hypothetical protein